MISLREFPPGKPMPSLLFTISVLSSASVILFALFPNTDTLSSTTSMWLSPSVKLCSDQRSHIQEENDDEKTGYGSFLKTSRSN